MVLQSDIPTMFSRREHLPGPEPDDAHAPLSIIYSMLLMISIIGIIIIITIIIIMIVIIISIFIIIIIMLIRTMHTRLYQW